MRPNVFTRKICGVAISYNCVFVYLDGSRGTPRSRRRIQTKIIQIARIIITNGQTGSWGTSCGHVNRGTSWLIVRMELTTEYSTWRAHRLYRNLLRNISTRGRCSMIPTLTLCSLDHWCGMVDVYNLYIRVVNILTFIYLSTGATRRLKCNSIDSVGAVDVGRGAFAMYHDVGSEFDDKSLISMGWVSQVRCWLDLDHCWRHWHLGRHSGTFFRIFASLG